MLMLLDDSHQPRMCAAMRFAIGRENARDVSASD
jgi:hypothetical protein